MRICSALNMSYPVSCTHTHTRTHREAVQLISDRLQWNKGTKREREREKPLFMPLSFGRNSALCRLQIADWDCQHSVLGAAERHKSSD